MVMGIMAILATILFGTMRAIDRNRNLVLAMSLIFT